PAAHRVVGVALGGARHVRPDRLQAVGGGGRRRGRRRRCLGEGGCGPGHTQGQDQERERRRAAHPPAPVGAGAAPSRTAGWRGATYTKVVATHWAEIVLLTV